MKREEQPVIREFPKICDTCHWSMDMLKNPDDYICTNPHSLKNGEIVSKKTTCEEYKKDTNTIVSSIEEFEKHSYGKGSRMISK